MNRLVATNKMRKFVCNVCEQVGQLRSQIEGMEKSRRDMSTEYERQLNMLRSEVSGDFSASDVLRLLNIKIKCSKVRGMVTLIHLI